MRTRAGGWAGFRALRSEGYPDFVRQLGADIVNMKRGQQAHDGIRNGRRHHRDRLELRGGGLGEPIESVSEVLDDPPGDQSL